MKCIFCGYRDSKVLDSRATEEENAIRRRRECLNCGKRFTTYETIETSPILVIKNDNSRQPFNRDKIRTGIIKACEKRPVSSFQIDRMIDNIEKKIHNMLSQEIQSTEIGEMVMDELRNVDEVAYVRFASVYRQFRDIDHFVSFLNDFENMLKK